MYEQVDLASSHEPLLFRFRARLPRRLLRRKRQRLSVRAPRKLERVRSMKSRTSTLDLGRVEGLRKALGFSKRALESHFMWLIHLGLAAESPSGIANADIKVENDGGLQPEDEEDEEEDEDEALIQIHMHI